ncbi:MAG TPA: cysteine desulfurase [archaeon]|nr:cysteine desulfurase [archaeon]
MSIEKFRVDFPCLNSNKPPVYLDNACMTLKPTQVIDAMNEYYEEYPGCAGRSHHRFGKMATERFFEARKTISKHIGAKKPEEVIFTRNTTEGVNLVANSFGLKKGDVVLTTDKEHNSNLIPWKVLEKSIGIKHVIVQSKKDMTFDMGVFEGLVKGTKLVSFVHSSNLDGYTIPAKEVIKIAHENGALVLLDGAQFAPHHKLDVRNLDVDFYSFSGHKMLGPTGTGILYGKMDLLENLKQFMVGGDTVKDSTYNSFVPEDIPERFEAGLQNYAGMIGLAAAVKYLDSVGKENIPRRENELNIIASKGLSSIDRCSIIGPPDVRDRGGVLSFNIQGMDPHSLAIILDGSEIMIRSGMHCVHSWFNAHKINGCARASFYFYNTVEEVEMFVEKVVEASKLR